MKKTLFTLLFITLIYAVPLVAWAQTTPALEDKICDIRAIFCGDMAIVIVTAAIFFLGILMINGKLHWTFVLMVAAGVTIFIGADQFAKNFSTNGDFETSDSCTCD